MPKRSERANPSDHSDGPSRLEQYWNMWESARQLPGHRDSQLLRHVNLLARFGKYEKILELLTPLPGRDPGLVNAKAACCLRLGHISDALAILRNRVLQYDRLEIEPSVPAVMKLNFACALLLAGYPAGCCEILSQMGDESNYRVQRLRQAIRNWERQLPWFRRFAWKFMRLEPWKICVQLDFEPGWFH